MSRSERAGPVGVHPDSPGMIRRLSGVAPLMRFHFPRVVDDVSIRIVAAEVLTIAVLALLTGQAWLYAVLALDFAARVAYGPRLSPLAHLALRVIRPRLSAAPRESAGAPKRFAAAIGLVLTTLATVFAYVAGWTTATWAIGVVMVIFPALEAGWGLCVGCRVFAVLMRLGVIPDEVCLDCADITRRRSVVDA